MNKLYKTIQNWRLNRVRKAIEKKNEEIEENHYDMKFRREMCSIYHMNKDRALTDKLLELKDKESRLLGYLR